MANKTPFRTTFEVAETIKPIYTGNGISLDDSGSILATALGEDALLTDLDSGRQLAKIEGDGELISTLTLTPSASYLIICSRSLSLRIYSLHSSPDKGSPIKFELLRTFKPHTTPVTVLAVDQTSTLFATGAADGEVKVWDIRRGYTTHVFRGPNNLISALYFFELKTSNKHEESGISARNLKFKNRGVNEGELQNDASKGLRLASGSQDGKVRIWDLFSRKCSLVLDLHVSDVTCLDFSPEYSALLTGSRDKTIMWWDVKTWKIRKVVPILEQVECAGFLESGKYTYTGGSNGNIRLWQTEDGREITIPQPIKVDTDGIVKCMIFKDYILSVKTDHSMAFYSSIPLKNIVSTDMIDPLPIVRKISGTHDDIIDLGYLMPDRSLLALATNSEEIRIVSIGDVKKEAEDSANYFGADIAQLIGHEDIIICLDIDWSGFWIATGAKDNTARLWRIDATNKSFTCHTVLSGHAESVGAIGLPHQIPPESSSAYKLPLENPPKFIITGSQDQTVKKWDISMLRATATSAHKAPRAIYTRKAHDKDINAIDVNYNSQFFASASQDKTVKIWDLDEGEIQGVLRGHKRGVWSVKFAPQDISSTANIGSGGITTKGLVLTGSGDKTVKIWSLSDYSCLRTFEGHSNSVLKVCWLALPKSESRKKYVQLASAGGDGLVKVWDVSTGEVACTLDNHEDRVWALTVNPTTNMIISGSADSTITFWRDTSAFTQAAASAAATEFVEQEQQLQNYINTKSYREAITLALQLNHPGRLLALFKSIITTIPEPDSLCGLHAVDAVLSSLTDEQIYTLLLRLRDWNTNVKTAPVAQKILWTLVKIHPASRLSHLKVFDQRNSRQGDEQKDNLTIGKNSNLRHSYYNTKELWNALKVYSDKHYKKFDAMIDASYLVEYTLKGMGALDDISMSNENDDDDTLSVERNITAFESDRETTMPSI